MPYAPARPCTTPGCPELITERGQSKCPQHRKEVSRIYELSRGSSSRRGYDRQWQVVREQALKRDEYICQTCKNKGRAVPATIVDHSKAFHGKADPLRLDLDNLVSLCRSCHSHKTNRQDGGFGNPKQFSKT